jgi:CBS domain-containing protein
MNNLPNATVIGELTLAARTAADLMTPDPVSIEAGASLHEAIALLTDRGYSAAPVIDEAGRPLGVLSRTDIVTYDREKEDHVPTEHEYFDEADRTTQSGEKFRKGFQVVDVDRTEVRDIMTPLVFTVPLEMPAAEVVREMLERRVHRLFVVDEGGILVGVISALDVLRHMCPVNAPRKGAGR